MTTPSDIRLLAGAVLMATIAGCGLSLTIALLAVRLDAAGYSGHAIGFNTAAGGMATLLGAPCIPWLARRIGVARLLLVALALGGVSLLAFTWCESYGSWLALRFVIGLAVTVLFVLSEFWITTAARATWRGAAIGVYATSLGLGFAVGPILLARVGTHGAVPFYCGAGLFWAAIIPLLLTAGGAPALHGRSGKPFWAFLREAPTATLAGMLHGAIEVAGIGLLPVYALRAGIDLAHGALFATLFVFGNCLSQAPLGLLSDRIDRRHLLAALAAAGLAGALGLAALGPVSLLPFEMLLLIWGGIVGGLYPVGLAHLGARYRDADLAGANAAYVMTYALGMLGGPPLIGLGLDLVPPQGFFLAIGLFILLYLIVVLGRLALARRTRGLPRARSAS